MADEKALGENSSRIGRTKQVCEKIHKCKYDGCNGKFTRASTLNTHIRKEHLKGVKMITCPYQGCFRSFHCSGNLVVH
jgi:uncharacterized Zn-finger protein